LTGYFQSVLAVCLLTGSKVPVTFVFVPALATLVYAIVNSRIDYHNTVLAGAPRTVTDMLQCVLNATMCIVTCTWKWSWPGLDTA